jgi:hypothetical protein
MHHCQEKFILKCDSIGQSEGKKISTKIYSLRILKDNLNEVFSFT